MLLCIGMMGGLMLAGIGAGGLLTVKDEQAKQAFMLMCACGAGCVLAMCLMIVYEVVA